MTLHKHLKERVRARMLKTGERYTVARRHVLGSSGAPAANPASSDHLPGNVAATTALRILLQHAGVTAPHTQAPFSEALLFGIAGGIGIGVFAIRYAAEDISTFFLAGRHSWHDDLAYLQGALGAVGLEPAVHETTSARAGEAKLREVLSTGTPCIAWVDSASLPHWMMPARYQGGGYHVVTAYRIDDARSTAWIGDLGDDPVEISLRELAAARARIRKQRNRLLWLPPATGPLPRLDRVDLRRLIQHGMRRCHESLRQPAMKSHAGNFRLDALVTWADRLHGSEGEQSWARMFRPGANLWSGLRWIHESIELHGTGGGLCRPLQAEFLTEAARAIDRPELEKPAARYRALAAAWSGLADAALPATVPLLDRTRALLELRTELYHTGAGPEQVGAAWQNLDLLEREAARAFKLSAAELDALLKSLRERVLAIHAEETAALEALAVFAG